MNFSNFIGHTVLIICRCEQNLLLNKSLKFRFINKATAKVKLVWNFDLRIFSVYGHGARVSLCCRFRPPFLWFILWGSSDNKRRFMARNSGKTSPPSCCFFYFGGLNQPCNKKPSKYPALWVRSNSIFIYVLLWINILFDMKYKFPVSTKHGWKTKAQPQFLRHDPFTHSMADQIFMADWLDCILEIHGSGNLT